MYGLLNFKAYCRRLLQSGAHKSFLLCKMSFVTACLRSQAENSSVWCKISSFFVTRDSWRR